MQMQQLDYPLILAVTSGKDSLQKFVLLEIHFKREEKTLNYLNKHIDVPETEEECTFRCARLQVASICTCCMN